MATAQQTSEDLPTGDASLTFLHWASLAILLLFFILSSVDRAIIGLMVDLIKADLEVTDFQIGLLQGLAFASLYALASIPMAWLADRTSKHWVIFGGVTFWSLATALCGMAGNYWQLFLARIGVGAGEATLSPSAYALVSELFPPRRIALAIGVLAGGLSLGGGFALAIGGAAVQFAEQLGPIGGLRPWQLTFLIVGIPGIVLAPLIFVVPRPQKRCDAAVGGVTAPGFWYWLRRNWPVLTGASLGLACSAVQAYAVMTWAPAYFSRHFGQEPIVIGSAMGASVSFGGLIGMVGGGWTADFLKSRGLRDAHPLYCAASALLIGVAAIVSFLLAPTAGVALAGLFAFFVFQGISGPSVGILQATTPIIYRARAIALYTATYTLIGMVVGPAVTPVLSEVLFDGPQDIGLGLLVLSMIFAPLSALSYLLTVRPARRAEAELRQTER